MKMRRVRCAHCRRAMPVDAHHAAATCSIECRQGRIEAQLRRYREKQEERRRREAPIRERAPVRHMAHRVAVCNQLAAKAAKGGGCECGFKRVQYLRGGPLECSTVCTRERPDFDRHIAQYFWHWHKWQTRHSSRQSPEPTRPPPIEPPIFLLTIEEAAERLNVTIDQVKRHLGGHARQFGPRTIRIQGWRLTALAAAIRNETPIELARQRTVTTEARREAERAYRQEYYARRRRLAILGAMVEAATTTEEGDDSPTDTL
jgi:hypothetical protein